MVRNHISSKMAGKSSATQRTVYHSLSLIYRRVLRLHPHLLFLHLHRRILWLPRNIQHQKEVKGLWVSQYGETRRMSQQKPKTQIKMMTTRNYTWMKVFQNTETLPVLLMNFLWSREQKWYRVKHSIFTHFPKDRNCDICLRTKIRGASCRRRIGTVVPKAEIFGVFFMTADHKVLSEGCEPRNNHRYAVVVQDFCNTMDTIIPV